MFSSTLRRRAVLGLGGALAFGSGVFVVSAKEKKHYVVFAAPGMEEVALKMVRNEPGAHRYQQISWGKAADGSDRVKVAAGCDVVDEDILFLASFTDSAAVVSQFTAMNQLCQSAANSLTVVAPYLPGTVAGDASTTTQILSSLPACGKPHRILTYDTVAGGNSAAKADVRSAAPMIHSLMREKKFNCVAFADNSSAGIYRDALKAAGSKFQVVKCDQKSDPVITAKKTVEVLEGSPKGMHVLLVNSVLENNCESLSEVSEKLMSQGALSVSVFCTHALPTNDWSALSSSAISKVYVTNSHPATKSAVPHNQKFEVIDMYQQLFKEL